MLTPAEVRSVRQRLKFTQAQFAHLLGVHALTVSKWERGLLAPNPHQEAYIRTFGEATRKKPDIGLFAAGALVGAGITAALFLLLKAVYEKEEEE